tara:strand:- start:32 stop:553 length:522 start_codon:yes stop_codon:yes gene_type:complete
MGQEFFINSEELESKIRQLLPSQGGAGAGFDLSASTQIIPIIDLTESAEGSNFRQDLQRANSHKRNTNFSVANTTSTIITTTGYFQILGTSTCNSNASACFNTINITDGTTSKVIWGHQIPATSTLTTTAIDLNVVVFLEAGDSCTVTSFNTSSNVIGSIRQIAAIDGTLINP